MTSPSRKKRKARRKSQKQSQTITPPAPDPSPTGPHDVLKKTIETAERLLGRWFDAADNNEQPVDLKDLNAAVMTLRRLADIRKILHVPRMTQMTRVGRLFGLVRHEKELLHTRRILPIGTRARVGHAFLESFQSPHPVAVKPFQFSIPVYDGINGANSFRHFIKAIHMIDSFNLMGDWLRVRLDPKFRQL